MTRRSLGLILALTSLLTTSVLSLGCATHQPPAGMYSPAGERAFKADALLKDLTAVSQTAINLNGVSGREHLKDRDTALIREFALVAGAGLQAYGSGASTLAAARAAVDTATLPPGIAEAARKAFDRAVIDHGANASALVLVVDTFTVFQQALSDDAKTHPKLTAVLAAIAGAVASIPLQ